MAKNVSGGELQVCSTDPMAGFYRSGCCDTGPGDLGVHVVCAQVTEDFLEFTKMQGNDLSAANRAMRFAGLNPGDRWCLCAARWREALEAGVAPPVVLEATHMAALEHVDLADLQKHAIDAKFE